MMTRRAAAIAFLESREGFGWIVILTFAAVLAVIAGCGFVVDYLYKHPEYANLMA